MDKKTVNVSIVAANYNNGRYLDDFFNSIRASTVLPKELILIDDGSSDNSLSIIGKYSELPYLKLIRFKKNRGFCHALNSGIEAATGKYILRIDPDDIMLKNRIALQFGFLEKNREVDVLGSNVIYFNDKTGKELMISNFPEHHNEIAKEYRKGDHGVQHPAVMVKSSVFKQYKYNQENVLAEDYEIFARMIKNGHKFANIKKPLVKMRIHAESAGSNIKFQTIKKTFELRDEIFNTSTSWLSVKLYYCFMLNYRRFLISGNSLLKSLYLAAAVICNPKKLLNRLF
jgi:glycosyltransferase involved in cell wall biosynthesis